MNQKRHTWSRPIRPDHHHTFRRCWDCALMRITRHENGSHWVEWRRPGGSNFRSERTPKCEAVEVVA